MDTSIPSVRTKNCLVVFGSVYRRAIPLPRPRPRPLPIPPADFLAKADAGAGVFLGASSTSMASKFKDSGKTKDRTVEPRTDKVAWDTGFLPRLKESNEKRKMVASENNWIYRYASTHKLCVVYLSRHLFVSYTVTLAFLRWQFIVASTPTTVPWITVPFFNSMVTCSRLSFCKNFTSFMLIELYGYFGVENVYANRSMMDDSCRVCGSMNCTSSGWTDQVFDGDRCQLVGDRCLMNNGRCAIQNEYSLSVLEQQYRMEEDKLYRQWRGKRKKLWQRQTVWSVVTESM